MFSTTYSFALIQQPSIVVDFVGSAFFVDPFSISKEVQSRASRGLSGGPL